MVRPSSVPANEKQSFQGWVCKGIALQLHNTGFIRAGVTGAIVLIVPLQAANTIQKLCLEPLAPYT